MGNNTNEIITEKEHIINHYNKEHNKIIELLNEIPSVITKNRIKYYLNVEVGFENKKYLCYKDKDKKSFKMILKYKDSNMLFDIKTSYIYIDNLKEIKVLTKTYKSRKY